MQSSAPDRASTRIGLGVGIGLGVPMLLLLGVVVWLIARRGKSEKPNSTISKPGKERKSDPPPEYAPPAELSNSEVRELETSITDADNRLRYSELSGSEALHELPEPNA